MAQVEHLNLVKFFGFLEHGDEKIVVVEYVPNGTLREHLDCKLFLFASLQFLQSYFLSFLLLLISRLNSLR